MARESAFRSACDPQGWNPVKPLVHLLRTSAIQFQDWCSDMYCGSCGKDLIAGDAFCRQCGKPVTNPSAPPVEKSKSKGAAIGMAILILSLLVLLIRIVGGTNSVGSSTSTDKPVTRPSVLVETDYAPCVPNEDDLRSMAQAGRDHNVRTFIHIAAEKGSHLLRTGTSVTIFQEGSPFSYVTINNGAYRGQGCYIPNNFLNSLQ